MIILSFFPHNIFIILNIYIKSDQRLITIQKIFLNLYEIFEYKQKYSILQLWCNLKKKAGKQNKNDGKVGGCGW